LEETREGMIPRTAIPVGNEEIAVVLHRFLLGEEIYREDVARFENELATYLGTRRIFSFNSGRTALYITLETLDLKPGEEVIVPAYTCAIVFEVILRLGLKPILVDVNPKTYNIDPHLISKALSSKTRVIIPIHLFGRPCEMDQILEIAEKHNLYTIEDAAQALGAEYEKSKVGTFGDLAIFSFGPGKSITTGEGGAIAVNNEELMEKVATTHAKLNDASPRWVLHLLKNVVSMKVFSNPCLYTLARESLEKNLNKTDQKIFENCVNLTCHGGVRNLHSTITLAKMPSFCAKMARLQLEKLDCFNEKRVINAIAFTKLLDTINDSLQLPKMSNDVKNTFTRYPIKLVKVSRDKIMKKLLKRGIDTEKPYHYLVDLFKPLEAKAPNAYTIAASLLTIPNHPLLEWSDVLRIATTLSNQMVAVKK